MRREFEDKIDRQSESTETVRKQVERCSSESEEAREQLQRWKDKFDKQKHLHFEEVETLEGERWEFLVYFSGGWYEPLC